MAWATLLAFTYSNAAGIISLLLYTSLACAYKTIQTRSAVGGICMWRTLISDNASITGFKRHCALPIVPAPAPQHPTSQQNEVNAVANLAVEQRRGDRAGIVHHVSLNA